MFYKLFIICLLFINCSIFKSGCYSQELEMDAGNDSPTDLMDTINTIKGKIKDIKNPEDIPLVADWGEKCKNIVGNRAWRVIRNTPSRITACISKYIKLKKVQLEIEDSMERGELDLVFKKYCGRRENILECVNESADIVKPCLNDQQLVDLNTTFTALEAALDFTCFENGDRIALFMAENGVQCLTNTSDTIKQCIETSIPEVKEVEENPNSIQINKFLINDENCKKLSEAHKCIADATATCDDPTPSNILDSLITQALKVTPCAQTTTSYALSASNAFYTHFWTLFPHILTLILAGLTAANILL